MDPPDLTFCAICQLSLKETTADSAVELARLPCSSSSPHVFHLDCLLSWTRFAATCPFDRSVFTQFEVCCAPAGPVVRIQQAPKPDIPKIEDDNSSVLPYLFDEEDIEDAEDSCELCSSPSYPEQLLICDGCDCLFHMYCLDPPLLQLPPGNWYCEWCKQQQQQRNSMTSTLSLTGVRGSSIASLSSTQISLGSRRRRIRTARTSHPQPFSIPHHSTSTGGRAFSAALQLRPERIQSVLRREYEKSIQRQRIRPQPTNSNSDKALPLSVEDQAWALFEEAKATSSFNGSSSSKTSANQTNKASKSRPVSRSSSLNNRRDNSLATGKSYTQALAPTSHTGNNGNGERLLLQLIKTQVNPLYYQHAGRISKEEYRLLVQSVYAQLKLDRTFWSRLMFYVRNHGSSLLTFWQKLSYPDKLFFEHHISQIIRQCRP